MDKNINLNTTYNTDSRSPLKELYTKNIKPEEKCDTPIKTVHLLDVESTFLENSVLFPTELNSDQNTEFDETVNSNQENLKPRYSASNSFDPTRKEIDEVIFLDNNNVKIQNVHVVNDSDGGNLLDITGDSTDDNRTFVNTIVEDFVKQAVDISATVDVTVKSELNDSSVSNISTNTVILNKHFNIKSDTSDEIFVDSNCNAPTIKSNNLSGINSGDSESELIKEQHLNITEQSLIDCNSNESLNLSSTLKLSDLNKEQNLNTVEQSIVDSGEESLNVTCTSKSTDLSSSHLSDSKIVKEGNFNTVFDIENVSSDGFDSFINAFSNKLTLTLEKDGSDKDEIKNIYTEEQTLSQPNESVHNLQLSSDCIEIAHGTSTDSLEIVNNLIDNQEGNTSNNQLIHLNVATVSSEEKSVIEINEASEFGTNYKNISFEISNSNTEANEILNETFNKNIKNHNLEDKNISFEINNSDSEANERLNKTLNKENKNDRLEDKNILFEKNNSNSEVNEILHETVIKKNKNINLGNKNISFEINKSNSEVNKSNSEANETLKETLNKDNKNDNLGDKNISFEINHSNSETNEILNETLNKEYKNDHLEEENAVFVVTSSSSQIIEVSSDINKESTESYSTLSSNSTYENNKSINSIADNLIVVNTSITEETHMSASEPNKELNETTLVNRFSLETSATCTNEMEKIINQNECFEKESDLSKGAVDNKESLEAKAQVYKEMEEKCTIAETECEKYKVQAADLKKELKSCRMKTVCLETEVADLKLKVNELNVSLEEYKQSATNKSDVKEQNEQLQRLHVSEEALKNEVKELKGLLKQNETHLKDLQRKEIKLSDDLSCKAHSEMQISRVMEEYEKSISSFITENEKLKKERDTAQMHLANIEMAFSDVHQKYERCKVMVQGYKDNEESFKQDIAMNRETIVIQEQKYETLKAHAMAQLEKSNQELAAMKKQHETEMARLTAQLKRYEIKNESLMESLQQKAKECEQLSAVCDEFIGNA